MERYDKIDAPDYFSDHVTVKCVMNINVDYVFHDENNSALLKPRSLCYKASPDQVQLYSMVLAEMLHDITVPHDTAICTNNKCINH